MCLQPQLKALIFGTTIFETTASKVK